jgi:thiosulfate reductase cytochrome b subunit
MAFLALLLSGGEIVLSHPRFYWGETGNVNMRPWLNLHLPSSRRMVPTGYGYVLPDQNGWSRYLHFQAAWLAVGTGLLYVLFGFFAGHFQRNLFPRASDLSMKEVGGSLVRHLRFERPGSKEAWSYNVLQRLTYLLVIFVLFPLMIWTGLAMSMGFTSAFPLTVRLWGGADSAQPALPGDNIAWALSVDSRSDGLGCRVSKPAARHDHRQRYPSGGVML